MPCDQSSGIENGYSFNVLGLTQANQTNRTGFFLELVGFFLELDMQIGFL